MAHAHLPRVLAIHLSLFAALACAHPTAAQSGVLYDTTSMTDERKYDMTANGDNGRAVVGPAANYAPGLQYYVQSADDFYLEHRAAITKLSIDFVTTAGWTPALTPQSGVLVEFMLESGNGTPGTFAGIDMGTSYTYSTFVNHSALEQYSAGGVRITIDFSWIGPVQLFAGRWWVAVTPANSSWTSPYYVCVSNPGSNGFPACRRDAGPAHSQPWFLGMYGSGVWQSTGPQRDISMRIEGYYFTPGPFSLLEPADAEPRAGTTPRFDWENADRATSYLLEVDDQPDFQSPLLSVQRIPSVYIAPAGILPPDTLLYWRVTATNEEGSTPCSQGSQTFTTAAPPPPCAADANADSLVNGADLSLLLGQFGQSASPEFGADFNNDGIVNGADLSILLSSFGQECL